MKKNEDWKNEKLGDVCIIERGGSPRPIEQFITNDENGINWIKIGDAEEGTMIISSTKQKIKPEGMSKSRFVRKGDFILSNSMSFGKPYILGIDGCIHDGWLVIRDDNNVFDKSYLYYFLGCKHTYQTFKKMAVGGVVNNLNSKMVRGLLIPVPPIPTQHQIVSELDALSDIITKKKQQLEELDKLAQATFYDMFGDLFLNDKGWKFVELNKICAEIVDCPHSTPKKSEIPTMFPCIRTSELKKGQIEWKSMQYVDYSEYKNRVKRLVPQKGDIVYGREGSYGDAVCLPETHKFCLGQRTMLFRPKTEIVNSVFLLHTVISEFVYTQAKKKNSGSTVGHVNVSDIKKFSIPIPPINLQNKFVERIESIEKQKGLINKSIEDVQQLFDYTMDKYFN